MVSINPIRKTNSIKNESANKTLYQRLDFLATIAATIAGERINNISVKSGNLYPCLRAYKSKILNTVVMHHIITAIIVFLLTVSSLISATGGGDV